MKIVWTQKAESQLNNIFNYIAADSTLYAYRTVNKIIDITQTIAENPKIGRKVPEFNRTDIREMFVYSYRVINQLQDDNIHILIVIHGSRLLPDKL